MSSIIEITILATLSPYFIHATPDNPSHVWARFEDEEHEGIHRCRKIYMRCVHCNLIRFTEAQLSKPPLGVDTLWCPECSDNLINVVKKYTREGLGCSEEERNTFSRVWRQLTAPIE